MPDTSATIAPPAPPGVDEQRTQSRLASHGVVTLQWVDQEDKIHSVCAKVRDESLDGLGVFLDTPLAQGRTVWITDDKAAQQKAVVQYSRPRFGRWKIGLYLVREERRRVDRFPVTGLAQLTWGFLSADTYSVDVRVLDVSPVGASLDSAHSVPAEVKARLAGEQLDCMGTVRHCTPRGERYRIGIHFSSRSLDSREIPEGFTSLESPKEGF